MKTTVTESALREMINEILDDKEYGVPYAPEAEATPVIVDDTVDPSQAVTDPGDPKFNPQDNRELSLAITQIVKVIPDESIGPFYKKVKQVADDMLCGRDDLDSKRPPHTMPVEDDEMKNEQKRIEEAVRKAVRKILVEMSQAENDEELGPTGGDTTVPSGDVPPSGEGQPKAGQQRLKWGQKSSSGYEKKELTPFKDIAAATDMSVAGAKQAVDKAWRKGRFIDSMFNTPEEKQAYMMDLVNQYIEELSLSGEMTPEDLELLEAHPEMVVDLEGFQDFMREDLEDAGYYSDIEFDAKGQPIPRGEKEPAAATATVATATKAPREPGAAKTSYKIYGKKAGRPVHTRLKGKAYAGPENSAFKSGDSATLSPEDGKLRVKSTTGDHDQLWDPVDG